MVASVFNRVSARRLLKTLRPRGTNMGAWNMSATTHLPRLWCPIPHLGVPYSRQCIHPKQCAKTCRMLPMWVLATRHAATHLALRAHVAPPVPRLV